MDGVLKILIIHHWCHPEFGGRQEQVYEYEMSAFLQAQAKYEELTRSENLYSHTTINIVRKLT